MRITNSTLSLTEEHISGCILFEEQFYGKDADGTPLISLLQKKVSHI